MTDRDEHAVLDVVTFLPATSRGFEGDRQRIETDRYRERAPPVDRYENGERASRVQRLTRSLLDRVEWDSTGLGALPPVREGPDRLHPPVGWGPLRRVLPGDPVPRYGESPRMLSSRSRVGTGLM